ncbi:MAG: UMP kinase [Parcubacteria group bacterium]|nr:UMP kinase [Parcubacteria group bacterium]
MVSKNKWKVIALGGSVVRPDKINVRFLGRFRHFLKPFLRDGYKFVIVIGGGRLSREYQEAARKIVSVPYEDLDWIGIHATRINAHLLRTIFRQEAHPAVIDNPEKHFSAGKYHLIFASGSRPGWSTDYIAARLTGRFGTKEFIVAGRPAYVYDKDHAKFRDAKPIPRLTWRHYQKICGAKWRPGLHAPVDPVAAKFAKAHRLRAIVVRGTDLKNLARVLRGNSFKGTIVE